MTATRTWSSGRTIQNNLTFTFEYSTKRKKYKKGNFIIDVDEMSYGHKVCEIELMIEKEGDIKNAEDRIMSLAKEYDFEIKRVPGKRAEYLRLKMPDIYKELRKK